MMATKIGNEMARYEVSQNKDKYLKEGALAKFIVKFYADVISQYEKNLLKGDPTFPTLPLKFSMFKTLSHYNSNDKVVEKKYRSVASPVTKRSCSRPSSSWTSHSSNCLVVSLDKGDTSSTTTASRFT